MQTMFEAREQVLKVYREERVRLGERIPPKRLWTICLMKAGMKQAEFREGAGILVSEGIIGDDGTLLRDIG